jgi:hypothetical protein
MKIVKIGLTVAVLAAMGIFIWRSTVTLPEVGEIPLPKNQFVERINQEIDSLSKMPINKPWEEFYKTIDYHISEGYENQRLGNNEEENEQMQKILSDKLFLTLKKPIKKQS